ncbi:MAG: hypothetical protein KDI69_09815 [Xanthomonadales bacterium]|nr:hypothetical protein [Xanthomonadales bacterium]
MRKPIASLFLTSLLLAFTSLASAQSFSTLEERMTAAQFKQAGLDKLSAEELATLNGWLQSHVGSQALACPTLPAATPASDGSAPMDSGDRREIVSQLMGDFKGWTGKTTFHLENGQVWQQVGSDKWTGARMANPTIYISPAFMGSWLLKVEGYNASTRVKRIR